MRDVDNMEMKEGWDAVFAHESATGKIYVPGFDRWGRPMCVFNNGCQNTRDVDKQMEFLAWSLNLCVRMMGRQDSAGATAVDKYVVFMHLGNFTLMSAPGMKATRETIRMLCNCFPERLGHCIAFDPPAVFEFFFNGVKGFIDPRTAAKMKFVRGDTSDGSANDLELRRLIGEDWKELTGVGQHVYAPPNPGPTSPGYDHTSFWPRCMRRVNVLQAGENDEDTVTADTTPPVVVGRIAPPHELEPKPLGGDAGVLVGMDDVEVAPVLSIEAVRANSGESTLSPLGLGPSKKKKGVLNRSPVKVPCCMATKTGPQNTRDQSVYRSYELTIPSSMPRHFL